MIFAFASVQVSAIGSLGKYIITQNIICFNYFISKFNLFINDEFINNTGIIPKSLPVLSTEFTAFDNHGRQFFFLHVW